MVFICGSNNMISLDDVFTALENAYTWTSERICGHFTSMWEILVNTWHSENNPVRGFSFDFVHKWQLDHHWDVIQKNYQPLLAAFVYAFVVLLMVKGIWYCVCYLCGSKSSRYGGVKATEEARRWFLQAQLDHQSSRNDMASEAPAYEWACIKCHQVWLLMWANQQLIKLPFDLIHDRVATRYIVYYFTPILIGHFTLL